jgi:hypothetical protein
MGEIIRQEQLRSRPPTVSDQGSRRPAASTREEEQAGEAVQLPDVIGEVLASSGARKEKQRPGPGEAAQPPDGEAEEEREDPPLPDVIGGALTGGEEQAQGDQ